MTILEVAVIVLAMVVVLQAVALGFQSRRIDGLELRINRIKAGGISVNVRGTQMALDTFLTRLLRHLRIQVDHQPESVVLVDEKPR